jgi:uncharacterized protein YjeT (DUF2065 family)
MELLEMFKPQKVTKSQLIKMINELETHPDDKIRILGQSGITVGGVVLGAAAAGTVASVAGATSIFGLTTAASWIGVSVVAATPAGWVIGCAAVVGAAAYGVSNLIHGGSLSEGRRLELLQKYREDYRKIEAKEIAGEICDNDRTQFILSLRELIEKDAIPPVKAFNLILQVEEGRIHLSQACSLAEALLGSQK